MPREKDFNRIERELAQERAAREKAERLAREAGEREKAQGAKHELVLQFVRAGASDPEYLLHLLKRETSHLSAEQAKAFDEAAWLEKVRVERGYLFDGAAPARTRSGPVRADEVDPKTGKYLLNDREKQRMIHDLLANADGRTPEDPVDPNAPPAKPPKNAEAVDPATGKYVVGPAEKQAMLRAILKGVRGEPINVPSVGGRTSN